MPRCWRARSTGAVISQPIFGIAVEFATALLFGLLVIAFAPLFGPVTLVALGAAFASMLVGHLGVFLCPATGC